MYYSITQEFKTNSEIDAVASSTEAIAAANVKMLDDLHEDGKKARVSEGVNNTSTPATGRPRRGSRAVPTSRQAGPGRIGSESNHEVSEVAEDLKMKQNLAAAKLEKKRVRDRDLAKRLKDKRRRIRAEGVAAAAAEEVKAAELVVRVDAKAAPSARTSPPPLPNAHLALLNQKMDKPTAANPDVNSILLAVMASLTRHDATLNRIKHKSLESRAVKLEAKITRMKEEQAAVAHHHDVLAAFKLI